MLFGTAKRLAQNKKKLNLIYNLRKVNSTGSYKYLGSQVDQNLNLSAKFNATYKKASARTRLIYKLKSCLTDDVVQSIYTMMILPIIRYNCIINLNLTRTQNEKFKSLSNRVKRVMTYQTKLCRSRTKENDMLVCLSENVWMERLLVILTFILSKPNTVFLQGTTETCFSFQRLS